jgi:hypothetical protein
MQFLKIEKIEASAVLHHWQIFEVSPCGPFFIPRPGPRFLILIGMLAFEESVKRTDEICAYDPLSSAVKCTTGETFCLGAECGFTPDLLSWYRTRHFMHASNAKDVTQDFLILYAGTNAHRLTRHPMATWR